MGTRTEYLVIRHRTTEEWSIRSMGTEERSLILQCKRECNPEDY